MGYRHYLYAVPKKQVDEIRTCKTTKDWIDFAKRNEYRYEEDLESIRKSDSSWNLKGHRCSHQKS